MRGWLSRVTFSTFSLSAVLAVINSSAIAQDFYKGKILTLVISNNAGSGCDIYGQGCSTLSTEWSVRGQLMS